MDILNYKNLSESERIKALTRPAQEQNNKVFAIVNDILKNIKEQGDKALFEYSKTLDKFTGSKLELSADEIEKACNNLDNNLKHAIDEAYINIEKFHKAQLHNNIVLETSKGITCEVHTQAIEKVGLYVPGGSAPLVSTALMLAIPAKIAQCEEIILCSPPPISNAIIYAASKAGVKRIFNLGGAQAIAAMAYGTESVPKVLKIFGPGNQFVTMAKRLINDDPNGAAIDMPAGPSEVLVIADSKANPKFVASDLLSQAEHGPDSQVILLSDDKVLLEKVNIELEIQLDKLPRKEIASKALSHSRAILCQDLHECALISNRYAPEHLIVQIENPRALLPELKNAGSIFLGAYTPESLGDYASGTNHTLPTYGYAKTASALGTDDYRRRYTVSCATFEGLQSIANTVETMADAEGLFAHKNAVSIRIKQ